MVELSRIPSLNLDVDVGGKRVRLLLPRLISEDIDVLVNAPVPKCHVITRINGALKNLYGLIPDPFRGNRYRHDFNRTVVVDDGVFSLDGRGPILGNHVRTNVVVGANNSVVADSLISRFFDMAPMRVGHLRLATREGIGTTDLNGVRLRGNLEPRMRLRPRRAPMEYFASFTFKSRLINKIVMSSPVNPLLYRALRPLRSKQEVVRCNEDMGQLSRSQFKPSQER